MISFKKLSIPFFCFFVIAISSLIADTESAQSPVVIKAETLMQKGNFKGAYDVLQTGSIPKAEKEYADWLEALSLYKIPRLDEALDLCLKVTRQGGDNPWIHKLRYLSADIYLQKKEFQKAQAIYENEAKRLLSENRKEEIASVYINFAEKLSYQPRPDQIDLPAPDYEKAYTFYAKALELKISPALKDEVRFRMAQLLERDARYWEAANEYKLYLQEFDPDWQNGVGSENNRPAPIGRYRGEARYFLAESLIKVDRFEEARRVLEDLLTLLGKEINKAGADREAITSIQKWQARAMARIPATYHFPFPPSDAYLEAGLKHIRSFLSGFPDHPLAVHLAWQAVAGLNHLGRTDQAIEAARGFMNRSGFKVKQEEQEDAINFRKTVLGIDESPVEAFDRLEKSGLFLIGGLLFQQKDYPGAIRTFTEYTKKYPNGPDWTHAQQGILNAEYQIGVDFLTDKQYATARKSWEEFLIKHPLDPRSGQILFAFGQIAYQQGIASSESGKSGQAKDHFEEAIGSFQRLIKKYPRGEESSLAQLRIGEILANEFKDYQGALAAYAKLTWGSHQSTARARIAQMTEKELLVKTERIFRTDEPALITLQARNVKKVKLSAYKLNLSDYFRKYHTIKGVEDLDLALIAPDITWEAEIKGYQDYLPLEQKIRIPMDGPGVYAVNVSEEDYEATTLVIRSDFDLIVKSSRSEVLVYLQNMRTNKPVPNADLLIADETGVIFEGKTGRDGVLRAQLEALKATENIGVFAGLKGNIASNGLDLQGLGYSKGLAPKGYLYTDRPVYSPGQAVRIRGIVRTIKDGSYFTQKGEKFNCAVVDTKGRIVFEQEVVLSPFGTFLAEVKLSPKAIQGQYSLRLTGEQGRTFFNGRFLVEEIKLEKVKLTLDFDKEVYFRGETIHALFRATYYYGQVVANKELRYTLPDGREFSALTNDNGQVNISFDTTSLLPGTSLKFSGKLISEQTTVRGEAFLAVHGFGITLTIPRPQSFVGESVEITAQTLDAGGKPVSRKLELTVSRRVLEKPDPLLLNIPWLSGTTSQTWTEKIVQSYPLQTDNQGLGRLTFTPQQGGQYVYLIRGEDRFGNIITAKEFAQVSGEETKLRLSTDSQHYKVGQNATIRIYAGIEKPRLALITSDGEGVIEYQVTELKKGVNSISTHINHSHFPNFAFSVSLMDENRFESVSLPFTVERELKIAVKPEKPVYAPGETANIEVKISDHLGQPVETEFSLALVNEAVFSHYQDPAGNIVSFFQSGALREAQMRTESSCTFRYIPQTRPVNQEILIEDKRVETTSGPLSQYDQSAQEEYFYDEGSIQRAPMEAESSFGTSLELSKNKTGKISQDLGAKEDASRERRPDDNLAGFWQVYLATDKTGKNNLSVPLPHTMAEYRLTVKGCTVDTLVGQAHSSLIVRKDFFADLKVPDFLMEGDSIRLLGEVHNLTAYQGGAQAVLILHAGDKPIVLSQNLSLKPNGTSRIIFPAFTVPAKANLAVSLEVRTQDSFQDSSLYSMPIKPWGLPYTDKKTGTAQTDRTVFLELPDHCQNQRLTVALDASLNQALINLVLSRGTSPLLEADIMPLSSLAAGPSELLALASLSKYLEKSGGALSDLVQTRSRARELVSHFASTQNSDGSWRNGNGHSEIEITAITLWALSVANSQGINVDSEIFLKSGNFLRSQYTKVKQDDYETRAMILHALSYAEEIDYTFVNRLYRNRNLLSEAALAYTALSLHGLGRREMGLEIISLLDKKGRSLSAGEDQQLYWTGEKNLVWENTDLETTALVLLAYEALKPRAKQVGEAAAYLLSYSSPYGFSPLKAKGVVTAALTNYFGEIKAIESDYILQISVNGQHLEEWVVKGNSKNKIIQVPAELVRKGKNQVSFGFQGKGEYVYTVRLMGFSREMKNEDPWDKPKITSREYFHEDLAFAGHTIGTSTMRIKELEYGQTALVKIDLSGYTGNRYLVLTDPLPSGALVLKETITGSFSQVQVRDGKVVFYFEPNQYLYTLSYKIAGYAPGSYPLLPPTLSNAFDPSQRKIGKPAKLTLLAPGEAAQEVYVMNKGELFGLGKAYFDAGRDQEALEQLEKLYAMDKQYKQADTARMLLWLRSEKQFYHAKKLVEYFEILKENYPDLTIPFEKILTIGQAYRDISEFERAYLVYRATIEASFKKDALTGGLIENAGELMGAMDFMRALWREYPDKGPMINTYFALAQELYDKALNAPAPEEQRASQRGVAGKPISKQELFIEAENMFWRFLAIYPDTPLTDDAAFSMINLKLDLKEFDQAITLSKQYRQYLPKSDFKDSLQYMEALGYFSLRKYKEAIAAAKVVAEKEGEDQDLATYILGQIYHAKQVPEEAIKYYNLVKDKFPDAREAADYFERKAVALDEVTTFQPHQRVNIKLKYRNIEKAFFQVYKVDLMKLYLKEKNLSRITSINLSGISPQIETEIKLGKGRDFKDMEKNISLNLNKEGAYLVICRGDDLFTSGLVLITPLEINVQEDVVSGRIRVNVLDKTKKIFADDVHVKVIGSANSAFMSGETDMRGIFIAENIHGQPTVIARDLHNRYAFYRGQNWLGSLDQEPEQEIETKGRFEADYRGNLMEKQRSLQMDNRSNLDELYDSENPAGVQVQEAY